MKRMISLAICLLMLCVLSVPALAAEDCEVRDTLTITEDVEYGTLDCWGALTIAGGVNVTADSINVHGLTFTVESGATVTTRSLCVSGENITTIESGATVILDGQSLEFRGSSLEIAGLLCGDIEYLDKSGTVKLMPGGEIDVTFAGSERSAEGFAYILSDYCVKRERDRVTAQYDHEPGGGKCAVCGKVYDENLKKITAENVIDGDLFIQEAGEYFIPKDFDVNNVMIDSGVTLTIPDGVMFTVRSEIVNFGTVVVYGTLDISGCRDASNPGGIVDVYSCLGGQLNGQMIGGDVNYYDHTGTWTCIYCGEEFTAGAAADDTEDYWLGSAISEGYLTIICTVAAAAVFGVGGFFLGRKKKKSVTANGVSTEDE